MQAGNLEAHRDKIIEDGRQRIAQMHMKLEKLIDVKIQLDLDLV